MPKYTVTFNSPKIKGTLELDCDEENEQELETAIDTQGFTFRDRNGNEDDYIYVEFGNDTAKAMTVEPIHLLPTAEGLYTDRDGSVWRITERRQWLHLAANETQKTIAERYMPFTELKPGRTY